jgi:hypothetical protein
MPNLRSSGHRTAVAPLWQPGAAELIRWAERHHLRCLQLRWQLSTRNRHSNRQSNFAIAQKRAMFQSYEA